MPTAKLTKSAVDKLRPAARETIFWDAGVRGFGVRIKPSGAKSYLVQYRNRGTGRSRRKTIGQVGPLISFSHARAEALRLLGEVARGGDPVDDIRTRRKAERVSDLADQYLDQHARPKKRPKSVEGDISMLNAIILPKLGDKAVNEVKNRDISALHNQLRSTPYRANRTLALLSKMFDLSIRWGLRSDNPAKGIEKFAEEKRHRWLSDSELARLTKALDDHPNQQAANAIRLQLLTGARIGEVLSSRWQNFDLERGVWIKPSHHTKQKRTEHLPLSGASVALLRAMKEASHYETDLLFPGRIPGKPIKNLKRFWKAVTSEADLSDYRLHDNRHTHASHLVSSGLSLPIVGRLLGHTNPMTTQRYAHLADDPLRQASEVMAKKLAKK